jgi:hypothetical protein
VTPVAGDGNRVAGKARIGIDKGLFDIPRRDHFIAGEVMELFGNFDGLTRFAHEIEIFLAIETCAGAVLIPFVKNQPRAWHQVQHRIDDVAIEARCRHLAFARKAALVLRPKTMDDE